jgi:hypothetical protein
VHGVKRFFEEETKKIAPLGAVSHWVLGFSMGKPRKLPHWVPETGKNGQLAHCL